MAVTINRDLLDHLFPANLFLDGNLKFSSISSSLRKHFPDIEVGSSLFHHFDMPGGNDWAYFQAHDGQLKILHLTSKCTNYKLAGAIVPQDGGYFLALHHVPTEKAFKENRFQISEFPPGDPRVQGLMLINLQRALIEESQDTALELAFERQRSVELLERISRIAGYMAHDFNNFLSIIKLNCDRLSRELGHDERLERLVSIIRETAARGSSITGSLMKLSHQRTDTLMPVTIDKLIEDNTAFLRTIVGSNVTLSVNLGGGEAQSIISHVQLLNCLTNLLINSRDAMPNGGDITITSQLRVAALEGTTKESPAPLREYLAIEVADTGKGMTDAVLSRAFEPLFSTKSNGTGFGLASALEFAREMGGDASLDSAPGKGARVTLYFPTVGQNIPGDALSDYNRNAGRFDREKVRILLVEDEPYALEALVEMLEAEGYEVTACETGEAALQANERGPHDVLLTDIVMPGQRGTELARLACAQQPNLTVILMSGYVPDAADIMPGWMFIRKPMDTTELLGLIKAASPIAA